MDNLNEFEPEPKPKSLWLPLGAVLLVALLAGAAFLAGRLMNNRSEAGADGPMMFSEGGPGVMGRSASGAGGATRLLGGEILPPEELPKTQPDANGVFVRREDNSIFIGTGSITMAIGDEDSQADVNYDGPEIEVVVTQKTLLYRDVTAMNFEDPEATVQQEVAEGSLDEMNSQSVLSVWGKKTGNRIIADIVYYSQPVVMRAPIPRK